MRHFHSYGPVDCEEHFCVPRQTLVAKGVEQLIGNPEKGGDYFTVWAPRQCGKTWLIRQLKQKITRQYPEKFTIFSGSLGALRGTGVVTDPESGEIRFPPALGEWLTMILPGKPTVASWNDFSRLFSKSQGLWDRPLILLIDEVDTLPPVLLDRMAGRFRELYLARESHWLHGLALVGVRAVLGIESERGSPFNIQKSLHVPNFTLAETTELYRQYQAESGRQVEPRVVEKIHDTTQGQPGLVSWLGELLTEKYAPAPDAPIGGETWEIVWHKARFVEPNNTVMNLIAKAGVPAYQDFLLKLFTRSDLPFAFHDPVCSYLYLHGLITSQTVRQANGELREICRFASPFIQDCLYHALNRKTVNSGEPVLALPPLDDLADVFADEALDLAALLQRYKDYLRRLKANGMNPWKEQPRRQTDMHLTEAVGHFHLFSWLQNAVGRRCVISPEFPTGNGKVDLHLRCENTRGIIEVKSFTDNYAAKLARRQAAQYADKLGFTQVTIAMFVPLDEADILERLSVIETIDSVKVQVVAIGWT